MQQPVSSLFNNKISSTDSTTQNIEESLLPPPSSLFCALESDDEIISNDEIQFQLQSFIESMGLREEVLIIPPDYTRYHSQAGKITRWICELYHLIPPEKKTKDEEEEEEVTTTTTTTRTIPKIEILPALGTHTPMTLTQITHMFGTELASMIPSPFLIHDWRKDVVTIGYVPSTMVSQATYGYLQNQSWPAQLNHHVWSKRYDNNNNDSSSSSLKQRPPPLVLSIGQVVPHEVMGMANYNKNLFVGVGGVEAINLSHFIGAIYGIENMLGQTNNPLRDILNYASETYLENQMDIWYILTVIGPDIKKKKKKNTWGIYGFYIGRNITCYNRACEKSLKMNFIHLEKAPKKMIVYLDPNEFHSTWLGNKAIYRTRMAIADEGELIILAPGVCKFGEDDEIDTLIRTYGYRGTNQTMESMKHSISLQKNLSAAAHLIHGSSEGRFKIIYCPGKELSQQDIENVGFDYGHLEDMLKRYNLEQLQNGWNVETNPEDGSIMDEYYFIRNPALGLWSVKK